MTARTYPPERTTLAFAAPLLASPCTHSRPRNPTHPLGCVLETTHIEIHLYFATPVFANTIWTDANLHRTLVSPDDFPSNVHWTIDRPHNCMAIRNSVGGSNFRIYSQRAVKKFPGKCKVGKGKATSPHASHTGSLDGDCKQSS
jgi:hypothetical protein